MAGPRITSRRPAAVLGSTKSLPYPVTRCICRCTCRAPVFQSRSLQRSPSSSPLSQAGGDGEMRDGFDALPLGSLPQRLHLVEIEGLHLVCGAFGLSTASARLRRSNPHLRAWLSAWCKTAWESLTVRCPVRPAKRSVCSFCTWSGRRSLTRTGPSCVKRRFDDAQTSLDRLLATTVVEAQQREALLAVRRQTNPRQLQHTVKDQLQHLFPLPRRCPGSCIRPYESPSPCREETASR